MTWDQSVLMVVWAVVIVLSLALLIRVEWKDWGLVGLLIWTTAIASLVTLSNLNQWISPETPSTDVPGHRTMLWTWRYGAAVGGLVVLVGLLFEFHRNPPSRNQVARRLGLGLGVIGVIALGFWWAS